MRIFDKFDWTKDFLSHCIADMNMILDYISYVPEAVTTGEVKQTTSPRVIFAWAGLIAYPTSTFM